MVKANLNETTDKLIRGERTINPAYDNPELAKEIANNFVREDLQKLGYLRSEGEINMLGKKIQSYYGKSDLAEQILNIQPLYYDVNKIWWVWNVQKFRWELTDETDVLNWIRRLSSYNTINSKERNEILEALKQYSRDRKPEDIKQTWVQFKDIIVDVETGEEIQASPRYFVTNPIDWELHTERFVNTPVMDKIFTEWVGEDYVAMLYEILAYALLPSYPIHRLFCLIGGGMNGKSCFLRLLEKFIGKDNLASTELDTLIASRFEVTRLHKKLVCTMGETNFSEISKTSIIKKLTGEDMIGFEYKNKNPFNDYNYAKIFIATNNLPATTDKTIGFYRRWCIIDFPNQFSEQKDILADIPEEEYQILAVKCLGILKGLLEKREFTNEGSIEQRAEKYEAKSNFLSEFIKLFTEEEINSQITSAEFSKKFNSWCKENRHREMSDTTIGVAMKKLGYEQQKVYFNWLFDGKGGQIRCWIGLKWK